MPRPSAMAMLALALLVLLPQGCQAKHGDGDEEKGPPSWLSGMSAHPDIAQWRALCRVSLGAWNDGLLSCACPAGELFDVAEGCKGFERKASADVTGCADLAQASREDLQRCAADLLELPSITIHLDPGELSAAEVKEIGGQLSRDWTAPIRGVTVISQKTPHRTLLLLQGDKGAAVEWQPWINSGACAGRVNLPSVNPMRALRAPMPTQEATGHCLALVTGDGAIGEQTGRSMCDAVSTFVSALVGSGEVQPLTGVKVHYAANGTGCFDGGSALVVNAQAGAHSLTYNVVLQDGIPLLRMVTVAGPDEAILFAFLSPTGRVEGYTRIRHRATDRQRSHLLETECTAFDDRGRALLDDVTERGNRADLRAATQSVSHAFAPFPLGRRLGAGHAPVNALLIDSGIDPRVPGLAERLGVTPRDERPSFEYSRNEPIGNLLDILDDDGHGTRMATIVAGDLPSVMLHLLRAGEVTTWGPSVELLHRWQRTIRETQSRVVNISYSFTQGMAECGEFFGALFGGLPEVLFVVGTGNDGSRNSVDACPSSLGRRFNNVLTVAGADAATGRLAKGSSYGREVAKVAAPFRGDTISTAPTRQPLGEVVVTQHEGTSISAALVSNAALRMIVRHPRATAQQLVRAFMKTCTRNRLDVACEGEVSFERLERYLR